MHLASVSPNSSLFTLHFSFFTLLLAFSLFRKSFNLSISKEVSIWPNELTLISNPSSPSWKEALSSFGVSDFFFFLGMVLYILPLNPLKGTLNTGKKQNQFLLDICSILLTVFSLPNTSAIANTSGPCVVPVSAARSKGMTTPILIPLV
jgi:hypothetical protein